MNDNKNWRGTQEGINYDGDMSKVKFSVFRELQPNKVFPLFLTSKELKLDDILFVETKNFIGYASLDDYMLEKDGTISHFAFRDSGIATIKQHQMVSVVNSMLLDVARQAPDKKQVILLSVTEKND